MPSRARDDGLSEVVGFVLILGVIVVALSLYQLYGVPAAGREDEIAHMNAVKGRFVDYKIALDSLWINSLNTTRSAEGVTLSTAFDLGTGGGYTQGGGVLFPVLAPIASGGKVSVNEHQDTLTITRNGGNVIAPYTMGEIAYESSNNYWIRQRYVYQMGGLFLEQDSGTAVRLSPLVSVYSVNSSTSTDLEYRLRVKIAAVQIFGGQETWGQGVARVDTRLREGVTKVSATAEAGGDITVTVNAHDEATATAWRQAFIDATEREGVVWGAGDDALPVRIVQTGNQVSMTCRPETGAEPTRIQYVDLDVTRVGLSVGLQQSIMA
ncbi:hypothetical protein F8E02_11970 [Methanoculleus sp. Wushi-C6]|uniref:Uncharacterized protein n=1 Tax=Methanoculleus caldifontis TaxID=2651577 RepID=A0ABU3X3S3_9EURY|nr:hypothetical protein [Methanoculleus sp. Wushi-C6]MDV2482698.1 hypothetical protein [Methanoculleus sp. Wushi-C6]